MVLCISSECKHLPYNQAVLAHSDRSQFANKHTSWEKNWKEQPSLWHLVAGYMRWPHWMASHSVTSHKLSINLGLKNCCLFPSTVSMWKSSSVPPFFDAQKFFSSCQSKWNADMLLIFPEMAPSGQLVLAPKWSWQCRVCLAELAVKTWIHKQSIFPHYKGQKSVDRLCLSDICTHLQRCQGSWRRDMHRFLIFTVDQSLP